MNTINVRGSKGGERCVNIFDFDNTFQKLVKVK